MPASDLEPHWSALFWKAMPTASKVCIALLSFSALLVGTAFVLIDQAGQAGDRGLVEASTTLNSLGATCNRVGGAVLVLGGIMFLISLPLITPKRIERRLARRMSLHIEHLVPAAEFLRSIDEGLKKRGEELEYYDKVEKLREAGVQAMIDRQEEANAKATRLTIVLTVVTAVLGTALAVALEVW